jgi:hypothetical protein
MPMLHSRHAAPEQTTVPDRATTARPCFRPRPRLRPLRRLRPGGDRGVAGRDRGAARRPGGLVMGAIAPEPNPSQHQGLHLTGPAQNLSALSPAARRSRSGRRRSAAAGVGPRWQVSRHQGTCLTAALSCGSPRIRQAWARRRRSAPGTDTPVGAPRRSRSNLMSTHAGAAVRRCLWRLTRFRRAVRPSSARA